VVGGIALAAGCASRPLTPEQAKAYADDLIRKSGAADLFENATTGPRPLVRHKASGLLCAFVEDSNNEIQLYDGGPRGSDVGCMSHAQGALLSMYAWRPPAPMTLDQAYAKYMGEIRRDHAPVKTLKEGLEPPPAGSKVPPLRNGLFELNMNGKTANSRLSVAVVNGWVVEQRLTSPPIFADRLDKMGETVMRQTVTAMVDHPGR
jgi:hypothetical protein